MKPPIPLSLYVHIPWCVRKCPYCDFNSHAAGNDLPETAYVDALLADLDTELSLASNRPLVSVFFGGGTPSLFSGPAIRRILDGIRERCQLSTDCEITLEANPGTADSGHFAAYRDAGVNRLSIGVQSFDDRQLVALGRIHRAADALHAIRLAQQTGFTRINTDLMHGLPGQQPGEAAHDLQLAIDSGLTHLSWYQLTIEPNTVFYSRPPALPGDNTLADIQAAGEAVLQAAGFAAYEVSAWSSNGDCSRHNLNYWSFGDYIGIGAGAHGKLTLSDGRIVRRWKTRAPADYLSPDRDCLGGETVVGPEDQALEFFMNALRLREGVPAHWLEERTQVTNAQIQPTLQKLRDAGLISADRDRLATTRTGFRYLDSVLQAFM